MYDRFKFRWFSKVYNKVFEVACLEFPNFVTYINELGDEVETAWNSDNGELIQCTGLKDKNGKLIYEGDIVRYTCPAEYCSDGLHKCQYCCSGEIASIHFDEEQAMFTYRSEIDQHSLTDNINTEEDLEVIGNIYENLELLSDENNA